MWCHISRGHFKDVECGSKSVKKLPIIIFIQHHELITTNRLTTKHTTQLKMQGFFEFLGYLS